MVHCEICTRNFDYFLMIVSCLILSIGKTVIYAIIYQKNGH